MDDGKQLVVIRRKSDAASTLSLNDFPTTAHVVLASGQGSARNVVELALAHRGLTRTVGAFVSSFSAMPFIVAKSDMLAVVPRRRAAHFSFLSTIEALPSPFEFERFTIFSGLAPLQASAILACSPRSGPLTATVFVSKIIVGISVGLNGGQCGIPPWLGLPLRAK